MVSLLNLPIFIFGAIWGITYLVQYHHLTKVHASLVTSMLFIGMVIGSPLLGWISDHFTLSISRSGLSLSKQGSRKQLLYASAMISLLLLTFLEFAPPLSMAALLVIFFLVGFISGAQVIGYPYVAELNPSRYTGAATGLASTLIMGGGLVQPIFGWLLGYQGDYHYLKHSIIYTAKDFNLAIGLMPVAFMITLLLVWLMKETFTKPSYDH